MPDVTVLIFHRPAAVSEPDLVRTLAEVRNELAKRHSQMFVAAGAGTVKVIAEWHEGKSFGEVLAGLTPSRGGLIALSGGAVPLLNRRDSQKLVDVAASGQRVALTNNRYSSDVVAVSRAARLRRLPPLPTDNALPRWLEEHAGYAVSELGARDRLGLDLDTPLDVALAALARTSPRWLRRAAVQAGLSVPRIEELKMLTADPFAELLVFGRSGSRTLGWLERNARCRVRFLAEERGLRASTPLAIGANRRASRASQRPPRATLGMLLEASGPGSLAEVVAGLGDAAIIDSRVLLAHRLGPDESSWPAAADRFASDLHRPAVIGDAWLRDLTESAANSRLPILLGGHSLVGPGIPLLLSR